MTQVYEVYDSAYPEDIPVDAQTVLTYLDYHPNPDAMSQAIARFGKDKVVAISSLGDPAAHIFDCESGALSPQEAADCAYEKVHANEIAILYRANNEGAMHSLVMALRGRNLELSDPEKWPQVGVYWWAAQWNPDNEPITETAIPPAAIGRQYYNNPSPAYDLSLFRVNLLDLLHTADSPPKVVPPLDFCLVSLPILDTAQQSVERVSVETAQRMLNARHGANLTIDGHYGPETAKAVASWQSGHSLPATGKLEAQTWQSLLDG